MEKLLLTGAPHAGKSTLLSRLSREYPAFLTGIVAVEIQDETGQRQGFSSGTLANPSLIKIAHANIASDVKVSRYGVDVSALNSVATLLRDQLAEAEATGKVLIFDEIGLIQSYSELLKAQIEKVLSGFVPAILSIKQDNGGSEWLGEIKRSPGLKTLVLNPENREHAYTIVADYVRTNYRSS